MIAAPKMTSMLNAARTSADILAAAARIAKRSSETTAIIVHGTEMLVVSLRIGVVSFCVPIGRASVLLAPVAMDIPTTTRKMQR